MPRSARHLPPKHLWGNPPNDTACEWRHPRISRNDYLISYPSPGKVTILDGVAFYRTIRYPLRHVLLNNEALEGKYVTVDQTKPLKRLMPAFRRAVRVQFAIVTFIAVTVFYLMRADLEERLWEHSLAEQAELCAIALSPGSAGDLSASVTRIKEKHDRLIAVAALDAYGQLHTVHPERSAYRTAARQILEDHQATVSIVDPIAGSRDRVMGFRCVLQERNSKHAREVLVLVNAAAPASDPMGSTMFFCGILMVGGLFSLSVLTHWFDRNVSLPLRSMARGAVNSGSGKTLLKAAATSTWFETAQIAERFDALMQSASNSERRARSVQRESAQQFDRRQIGLVQQLRRAKDQATRDPLTKLRNRSFLEDQLDEIFQQHTSNGRDLAAIMLDLDWFKPYNDTYGHQAGDALLCFVGALLRGSLRPTDHAVRYGGDEFLLLLPETDIEGARMIAERIRQLFRQYATRLEPNNKLSMSAGVASLKKNAAPSGHALIAHADSALYEAKRQGKNAVAVSA